MSRFYCPVIKTLIERNKISCRGNKGRGLLRDHWMATDNGLINAQRAELFTGSVT